MAALELLGLDTIWLAIPLAAGAGALSVWLYLPDARPLRRGPRTALLTLRAAAVALMALILLQPVLRFVHAGREKSTLVFFVDTSESMSVADTGIPPARVQQLVEGLKLRDKALHKTRGERAPEDLRARTDDLLKALEALASTGVEIAEWRAGLETVRGPAEAISRALMELDTARIPASDRALRQAQGAVVVSLPNGDRAAIETAAFLKDEFDRFEMEEGETDFQAAGRLKRLAQDVRPSAEKLTEQIDWLEFALGKRTRRDAVSSEARARSIATESTRLELALRALTGEKLGIVKELAKTHELRAFALARTAEHFDLLPDGRPVTLEEARLKLAPVGKATDLAGAVLAGVNEVGGATAGGGNGGRTIAGVVILSDGRQTVRGSPLQTAAALGARGIPVYAVGVGSKGRPRDAAVAEVRAPESVFSGDKIELEAAVTMSGIPGDHVPVTLTEGDRTLEMKSAAIENATGRVTFEVPTRQPGRGVRRFTISVPEFEMESTLGNNSREVAVKVVDDKLRATIVFEYPRWELRFVRNLIWRNRKMELDIVSYVTTLRSSSLRSTSEEPSRRELGRTRRQIMKSSVLILDDVAAERFTPEERKILAEFVSRRGGTVIMIAGPEHLPAEYMEPPLGELLPFREGAKPSWRVRDPGEAPFTLALTPEGRAEPFMRITDAVEGDENLEAFWAGLPGFFEYVAAGEVVPGTKVLLKARETGDPVLMVRRYGLGKVIFFAMHETWRWRYKVADRDHGRFWGNLLRYAGEEPFAVKDRFVSLDADRTVYSPGEPVNVRARVLDAEGLPVDVNDLVCVLGRTVGDTAMRSAYSAEAAPAAKAGSSPAAAGKLRSTGEGGEGAGDADGGRRLVRRPLEGSVDGGGVYRATFGVEDPLPAGDYTLRVESPRLEALYGARRDADSPRVTLEISIRPAAGGEFADTTFSEQTLAGMARASFGRYFDISQARELPEAVGKGWQERTTVTRIELWSSYYVYALVLALLSAEWIVRKRLGLV